MKKAQIQMGETIFVTMIIILLIIIGFVFLVSFEKDEAEQKKEEFFELDTITFSQLVSSLPEITCSDLGNEEESCFDMSRLTAFDNITELEKDISIEYYFEKLGNVNITIEQIYPEPEENEGYWEIYVNYLEEGRPFGNTLMLPITLYDPVKKTNNFGVLYLTKYN